MTRFSDFLKRPSIKPSGKMPMVHTTSAYYLRHIVESDAVLPQDCEVFRNKLSYFFFGRPAYKVKGDGLQGAEWELPACLIFDYDVISKPTRIFPFDTGAHYHKLVPNFIGMMARSEFEATPVADAPLKIVGAFFTDIRSYFEARPKALSDFEREFSPNVFDAEVKAMHRLATSESNAKLDDRRLSVEVQLDTALDLKVAKPLAVVAPLPYCDDKGFRDHVQSVWSAQLISYPITALSVEAYYALIYERVGAFYAKLGLI